MKDRELLLVGSVPFETAEEVIRRFGKPLGRYLMAMPDGEVGTRRWWVLRLAFEVFNGHPDIEVLSRPAPENGVERLVPRDRTDLWSFKVRDEVSEVRFGDPGWRLGFARDAIPSYFIFRKLREEGVVPADVRFQLCLPSVNSTVGAMVFPVEGDLERIRAGYEEALRVELANILRFIPANDLAVQFDCSMEITDAYGGFPQLPPEGRIERNIGQLKRLSSQVPGEAMLGFHFCFGTFGGWPRFAPDDLGEAVNLSNAVVASVDRKVDWVNIPVLDRSDDAFFEPLQRLEPDGARVFLGAIHHADRLRERLEAARKFLPRFGLSAYCGFGRLSTEDLPGIIRDHEKAVEIGRDVGVF